MEILFAVALVVKLIYDVIVRVVASVRAERQHEAYKKLRSEIKNGDDKR